MLSSSFIIIDVKVHKKLHGKINHYLKLVFYLVLCLFLYSSLMDMLLSKHNDQKREKVFKDDP